MLGFKIDQAKSMFFDREAVTSRLSKAKRRGFNRIGALTRKISRNSIKASSKAIQRRISEKRLQLGQLVMRGVKPNDPRRAKLNREIRELQRKAVSKPGKPPKSVTGLLKNNIFYALDGDVVVIGPVLLNKPTGAPETLEFGGSVEVGPQRVEVKARPYMGPAKTKVEPQAAGFFRDSL